MRQAVCAPFEDVALAALVFILRHPAAADLDVSQGGSGHGVVGVVLDDLAEVKLSLLGEAGFQAPLGHGEMCIERVRHFGDRGFVVLEDFRLNENPLHLRSGESQLETFDRHDFDEIVLGAGRVEDLSLHLRAGLEQDHFGQRRPRDCAEINPSGCQHGYRIREANWERHDYPAISAALRRRQSW